MPQLTFGAEFGLLPIEPVAPHRDDERICRFCESQIELSEWQSETGCCESCQDENLTPCHDCGEYVEDDDCIVSDTDGEARCECCHNDSHTSCCECGDSVHDDRIVHSDGGDAYCESCHNDRFLRCECCDTEIDCHNDSFHCEDGIFCADCHSDREWWEPNWQWKPANMAYDKMGSNRRFGIELETDDAPHYEGWAYGRDWGAVEDGSTSGPEFVSPPLRGNDGFDSVVSFVDDMASNGCEQTESCGYHLHVDLGDTTPAQRKAIALAYHYTRKMWEGMVAPHRRDTYYASRTVGSQYNSSYGDAITRDDILESDDKPTPKSRMRYHWINWLAFDKHKTVEIRSHEATTDSRAVINWARAHCLFIDYVKDMSCGQVTRTLGGEDTPTQLRELRLAWGDELTEYYAAKMAE